MCTLYNAHTHLTRTICTYNICRMYLHYIHTEHGAFEFPSISVKYVKWAEKKYIRTKKQLFLLEKWLFMALLKSFQFCIFISHDYKHNVAIGWLINVNKCAFMQMKYRFFFVSDISLQISSTTSKNSYFKFYYL